MKLTVSTSFAALLLVVVAPLATAQTSPVAAPAAPAAPLAAAAKAAPATPVAAPAPAATPAAAKAVAPATPAPVAKAEVKAEAAAGGSETGIAAYYGKKFAGRKTASGQRFNPNAMTAAHNTLPFGTKVKVTNTKNKRSVVLVINDRGPKTPGRIIDVSRAAAVKLGFVRSGVTEVTVESVGSVKLKGAKHGKKMAKKMKPAKQA